MTFTENSEYAMQNEKRYVYFILFSPFFGTMNVYILWTFTFSTMCCAIFFIRDILNYHILCKCKKIIKTMILRR